ncbi:hypothetical protein KSF_100230 [Reticulibacter mediterranei]|uniref:Sigma-70 family RNA polymerase sigma factor n=1 Tax=Reticulibacter mediterranei TaxID=2778369 RepID=A0A8J3J091_9CHLR|nr:sigma-70 family RNA polymerase sigma factor [Reticulibacter mediterranei]GHO99975.1 hypothetical protein KSF_100230 [Reticulibacter mediterranei]
MQLYPIEEGKHLSRDIRQVALYDHYGPIIFGYLLQHAPSLQDAEDVLLEVFLAALEQDNLAAIPPSAQLAWLRRVAQNKLANVHRTSYRHPQVSLDSVTETLFDEDEPEQQALQQEERRHLREQVQQLPVLQQYILQLRYGEGLRCTEIAALLNKREGTVRQLLSRTIRFLRRVYLQKEGEQHARK